MISNSYQHSTYNYRRQDQKYMEITLGFTKATAYLAVAVILTALAAFSKLIIKFRRTYHLLSKIPGPPGIPILGNVLDFLTGDLSEIFKSVISLCDTYGAISKVWFGPIPILMICGKEYTQIIMEKKTLTNRGKIVNILTKDSFMGGLFSLEGKEFKRHRKIVQSTFQNKELDQFVQVFTTNSEILINKWKPLANGQVFEVYKYLFQCTVNAVLETTRTDNFCKHADLEAGLSKLVEKSNDIFSLRILHPWLLSDTIYYLTNDYKTFRKCKENVHSKIRSIVRAKYENHRTETIQKIHTVDGEVMTNKVSLLDVMIKSDMSESEIAADFLNVIAAGAETTAIACSYALFLLGEHQYIQNKIFEEQKIVFQDDLFRSVTAEDLPRMVYLEQVIKETMRLFPPVEFLFRQADEEVRLDSEYVLPSGVFTVISIHHVHRDPKVFPDPERFDPQRFSPEGISRMHPYSYIPFGGGCRICVGAKYSLMEAKTMMSTLLRRYQIIEGVGGISSIKKRQKLGLTNQPNGGFHIRIRERVSC
ncbi:cytochrome P450 4C1-like [Periplaneta americana]|uniref:cytochrome P450 4C1-like n=1 Tax=Periplaneta americana TaxID=6978 RepID=UPI0037E8D1F2